ncbi:MAG: hypothetical protein QOG14_1280 [Mycobacterium sp.]|jgi:hypothetical protein|nr:hypothetical protein [Mycobacterium sp.]
MARLAVPTADTNVRLYLLAEAEAFRDLLTKGQPPEAKATIWAACSGAVDALAKGEEHTFHRFELPDDHPAAHRRAGGPNDLLILGTDDRLRLAD